MARSDARIILGSQPVDLFGSFQRGREAKQDSELFNITKSREAERLTDKKNAENALSQASEFQSIAVGAKRTSELLQSGDTKGAVDFLARRAENIQARGGDSRDTMEVLGLIRNGRLEQANKLLGDTVRLAELNGVLTPENTPEGFTLKSGDARFDADGTQVASNPKPLAAKTPEKRERVKDANDRLRFVDNGELVFPNVEAQGGKRETAKAGDGVLRYTDTGEAVFEADERELEKKAEKAEKEVVSARGLIREIVTDPALNKIFGPLDNLTPTLRTSSNAVKSKINRLIGNLTLEKIANFKGAVSDADLRLANESATILQNTNIDEPTARAELVRLYEVMGGDPADLQSVEQTRGSSQSGRNNPGRFKVEEIN